MIKTIIFDFSGVITTTRCFQKLSEELGKKHSIDREIIHKRLLSNESQYLIGKESTKEFWKKVCKGLKIPYSEFKNVFSNWYNLDGGLLELIKKFEKRISNNFIF